MGVIIPPGQERWLKRALRPRGPAADAFVLLRIEVRPREVIGRYLSGDREVAVRLLHPSAEVSGPRLLAGPFVVSLMCAEDAAVCAPLMASLHLGLSAIEGASVWVEEDSVETRTRGFVSHVPADEPLKDMDLLAVTTGLKPALRMSVAAGAIEEATHRLVASGLEVRQRGHLDEQDGRVRDVLCASPDAAHAERLADLERALFHTGVRRARGELAPHTADAEVVEEIGMLLGYPACCVEAHVRRVAAPKPGWAATYVAVRDAWVRHPHHRLDHVVAGHVRPLISFQPCTFRCGAALAYADTLARALQARDADALTDLEEALAKAVVVHTSGARGYAELDGDRVIGVQALPRLEGEAPDEADRAVLSAARGSVDSEGVLGEDFVLIDFRRPP
jgi:hypothetical protein